MHVELKKMDKDGRKFTKAKVLSPILPANNLYS